MKIIDAHVHLDRVAGEDILRMAWGGVKVAGDLTSIREPEAKKDGP